MITEEKEPPKFESPYPRDANSERIHAWIASEDVLYLRLLRPQLGTFTYVVGHLWKKLCAELRSRDIKDYTQCEEFETFVTNVKILPINEYESLVRDATSYRNLPGRPSPGVDSDSNGKHAGKRTKGVRRVSSAESKECTDVPSDDKKGNE